MRSLTPSLSLVALVLLAAPATAQDSPSTPVIVTSGEATVRRAPDRATITAVVETRAKSPREAQASNAQAMAAVLTRVAAAGVAKDAVRTVGYTLEEEADFVEGRRVPRDFLARNLVEVRLDDIARTGELADAVVQAGATSIAGIGFGLKDRAGAEREALRLAVADARARADAAAAGAGRAVDRVLRIEDQRESPPVGPRPMMTLAARGGESAPQTPIEPGVVEIRARVSLTVSIK